MKHWGGIWVFAILIGCSSSGSDDTVGDKGGTAEAAGASGQCSGELSELSGGCAATFDGSAAQASQLGCMSYSMAACDGLLWITNGSNGFQTQRCVYDAGTHALVGAEAITDDFSFCNGKSGAKVAGPIPSNVCESNGAPCDATGSAGAAATSP